MIADDIKRFGKSMNWRKRQDGYHYNKWLMRIGEWLYYAFAFTVIFSNYDTFFSGEPQLKCPAELNQPCKNPFYKPYGPITNKCDSDWCYEEYLYSGFQNYEDPNWTYDHVVWITILLVIGPYVINHYVYNKRRNFMVIQ